MRSAGLRTPATASLCAADNHANRISTNSREFLSVSPVSVLYVQPRPTQIPGKFLAAIDMEFQAKEGLPLCPSAQLRLHRDPEGWLRFINKERKRAGDDGDQLTAGIAVMNESSMQPTNSRSLHAVAFCLATLMGCTGTSEEAPQQTSTLSGIAMADSVCSLCHGLTGESVSPRFPKLAGQQNDYLQLQLNDFRNHGRSAETDSRYMGGLSHLTKTQITELAEYFSSQRAMQADNGAPDARGAVIFLQGLPERSVPPCSACHGRDGEGNGVIPRVAGQHASYMSQQIKVLQQTGQRPNGAPMLPVDHALSPADAESVARYMAAIGAKQ